ncbi:MAG TPA: exodeoxyribonuclease III [bacterium]|nr:exodeoxyribonuclease III [bacterium]
MEKFLVATFNCNSVRSRLGIILDWLSAHKPDALCLQETKAQDHDFPIAAFGEAGYDCAFHGQKSYNGVAIVSRHEMLDIGKSFGDGAESPEQARLIRATICGIPVVNTYVPQGFEPGSDKFRYKLEWLARLKEYFENNFHPDKPLLWMGDINIAPEPIDVYAPDEFEGGAGFHPDERASLKDIAAWGFVDIFRALNPEPGHYTFWDYRLRGGLSRNLGWRIDHIYATRSLAEQCAASWIDTAPRSMEKPSDHTFVAAEFRL